MSDLGDHIYAGLKLVLILVVIGTVIVASSITVFVTRWAMQADEVATDVEVPE